MAPTSLLAMTVALFSLTTSGFAADTPTLPPCETQKPITMNCEELPADKTKLSCTAHVVFCQQGNSTHLYGVELRTSRRVDSALDIEIGLPEKTSFKPANIKFNSRINAPGSQLTIALVRPIHEKDAVHVEGNITFVGQLIPGN